MWWQIWWDLHVCFSCPDIYIYLIDTTFTTSTQTIKTEWLLYFSTSNGTKSALLGSFLTMESVHCLKMKAASYKIICPFLSMTMCESLCLPWCKTDKDKDATGMQQSLQCIDWSVVRVLSLTCFVLLGKDNNNQPLFVVK